MKTLCLVATAVLLFAVYAHAAAPKPPDEVVAVVNGISIKYAEIQVPAQQTGAATGTASQPLTPADIHTGELLNLCGRFGALLEAEAERRFKVTLSDAELQAYSTMKGLKTKVGDPTALKNAAMSAKLTLAVLDQLGETDPVIKSYHSTLKWPVSNNTIYGNAPGHTTELLDLWWNKQYQAATIEVRDHDYDDLPAIYGVAPGQESIKSAGRTPVHIEFRAMPQLVSPRDPNAQFDTVDDGPFSAPGTSITFRDGKTGATFRDAGHILDDMRQLVKAGSPTPQDGLVLGVWPATVQPAKNPLPSVYLTSAQLTQAESLVGEMLAYNAFMGKSQLLFDDTDIRQAVAKYDRIGRVGGAEMQLYLKDGAIAKFTAFDNDGPREFVALIVDGRILDVYYPGSSFDHGEGTVGDCFQDLAAAQLLAERINQAHP